MVWASVHNAGNASVCHREAAVRRGPSDAGPCGLQGARALSLDDTEFTRSCSWDVQARRALGSAARRSDGGWHHRTPVPVHAATRRREPSVV